MMTIRFTETHLNPTSADIALQALRLQDGFLGGYRSLAPHPGHADVVAFFRCPEDFNPGFLLSSCRMVNMSAELLRKVCTVWPAAVDLTPPGIGMDDTALPCGANYDPRWSGRLAG